MVFNDSQCLSGIEQEWIMPYEVLVFAGVVTVGLMVAFMGGFGWFVYKDSHRKDDHSDH